MSFPSRRTFIQQTAVLAVGATGLLGCRKTAETSPKNATSKVAPPEYSGPLVDPATISSNFVWQQRVTARHGKTKGSFDAVLQKEGPELLVLGLTPFQTRAFALTQRGTTYKYEQFVPFPLPFSPQSVLIDIHRAFFFALNGTLPTSGTRSTPYKQETVIDSFADGLLQSRRYDNLMNTKKALVITYASPGYAAYQAPPLTVLTNIAYGYELRVETTA